MSESSSTSVAVVPTPVVPHVRNGRPVAEIVAEYKAVDREAKYKRAALLAELKAAQPDANLAQLGELVGVRKSVVEEELLLHVHQPDQDDRFDDYSPSAVACALRAAKRLKGKTNVLDNALTLLVANPTVAELKKAHKVRNVKPRTWTKDVAVEKGENIAAHMGDFEAGKDRATAAISVVDKILKASGKSSTGLVLIDVIKRGSTNFDGMDDDGLERPAAEAQRLADKARALIEKRKGDKDQPADAVLSPAVAIHANKLLAKIAAKHDASKDMETED